jgi:tetratricopeptide (TPR) repeat protein
VDAAVEKKMAELTRGATTQQEKARRIYDFVARNIRYVSLSFGVGRFQPHAATEVMAGSYGDCKDKHTLLAALLRAAGMTSYPVLIGSERKLDEDVPSPAQFDHVITAALIDKEWVWLDSTAEIAPYGLILYQLRDKQAVLAADDAGGGLRKTPAAAPVKNTVTTTVEGKVSESGALDSTVEVVSGGDSAVPIRMAFRATPQADWHRIGESIATYQGYRGKVSDLDVASLEEPEKPLRIRFKIHDDSYFTVPSSNVDRYVLPLIGFRRLPKKKPGQPLDIGPALEMYSKARIEFASNYNLRLPPDVSITRDYGQYSLSYRLANNALEAERTYILKVNQVPSSRRPDVESLRSVATNYAEQSIACDVRPAAKAAVAASVPATGTPQELRKAAIKALDQRDFENASELWKRLLAQLPDSEDAWDELGRAYSGLGDHNAAIAAYRKQVEVNAFSKRAYNDLGAELRQQGKYEDALAAYGKQLENVPVDNAARKNHGLLLLQLKRNQEALGDLEKASSATPDDPEIELALAQLYSWTGNQEKSRSRLMSVVGSTAAAPGGDWFSAALRDDIDPEQTLNDARRIVDGIGDQFDSEAYQENPPEVFSAMYFLALEWARIGWASFLKGDRMEGVRFLDAAWSLSQSGTVANRLARVYEKAGDTVKARHMLALAISAGGAEVERSRTQLAKLNPGRPADLSQGRAELAQMQSVKVRGLAQKSGQAEFILVFDGSSRPQRTEYREGTPEMRDAEAALTDSDYPVSFPENTSVKIVRRGVLTCATAGCTMVLKPLDSIQVPSLSAPQAQK